VECLASALGLTIKLVPPTGGGAEAVAIDDIAYLAAAAAQRHLMVHPEKISYKQLYNQHADQPYNNK
jgi:hypothetical protein